MGNVDIDALKFAALLALCQEIVESCQSVDPEWGHPDCLYRALDEARGLILNDRQVPPETGAQPVGQGGTRQSPGDRTDGQADA